MKYGGRMRLLKTLAFVPAALLFLITAQSSTAEDQGRSKVMMKSNLVTADPETMKWQRNGFTPWGMRIIVIH